MATICPDFKWSRFWIADCKLTWFRPFPIAIRLNFKSPLEMFFQFDTWTLATLKIPTTFYFRRRRRFFRL